MADSYLTRTPSGAGSRVKWTYSVWLKRTKLGHQPIWAATTDGNNYDEFYFNSTDKIQFSTVTSGTQKAIRTTRQFRDTSAWYHIVLIYDTGNSTDTDHAQLWINGVRETVFEDTTLLASGADNVQSNWNNTIEMKIGRVTTNTAAYFEGYMSHAVFVNDAVVLPTSFGQTDSTSGEWKFKAPSGITFGTNGFHLKFENSGNLGLDSSGGGNNFTTNGSLKQSISTPTNTYTTLNNLSNAMAGDYTIGNTTVQSQNASDTSAPAYANYGVSKGKWYWEVKCAAVSTGSWTYANIGITALLRHSNAQTYNQLGAKVEDFSYYAYNGNIMNNDTGNTGDAYGNTYTLNDIIGVALDLDNNKLYFHKNGTYQNSGVPTSGSTGTGAVSITDPDDLGDGVYYPAVGDYHYVPRYTFQMNFGEGRFGTTAVSSAGSNSGDGIFEYDVPNGYYALNTKNINTYG